MSAIPGQRVVELEGRRCLLFGRAGDPLSNFYGSPITVDAFGSGSMQAATVEHGFQALKAARPDQARQILIAPTAAHARELGRQCEMRSIWEQPKGRVDGGQAVSFKAGVMYALLRAKFTQHERLGALLDSTLDLVLIEDAPWDGYWGAGPDGRGKNALGHLLMLLRAIRLTGGPYNLQTPTPAVPR